MSIRVNGQDRDFDDQTLASVITRMHLNPKRVAAELNGVIIRRSDFESTQVRDGDVLELVGFVGGG